MGERRAAWEASKTIGAAVADDVRELARLRNEVARGLGFRDWFALAVAESEMDEERLLETLAACDAATAEAFAAVEGRHRRRPGRAASAARTDELRPWHYADPFFQEVPVAGGVDLDPLLADRDVVALAARTFDGIGIDTAAVIARSDLYPREGKCQHAFCLDVDRAGDVRVLANVVDDAYWADTMLHELGHAAFDLGIDPGLPFLLRDCHLTVTEGIAILMGGLAREGRWLRDVAGVDGGGRDRARVAAARVPDGRAAPLHALGARDDDVRARALRRSGAGPRRPLVGARRALPGRDRTARRRRPAPGRRRSTSAARRSTTTRTSTAISSPPSCARLSPARRGASSGGRRRAHSCASASSGSASRSAGTA